MLLSQTPAVEIIEFWTGVKQVPMLPAGWLWTGVGVALVGGPARLSRVSAWA
jgi:hypothetical protein